jgi:hypothetical protein
MDAANATFVSNVPYGEPHNLPVQTIDLQVQTRQEQCFLETVRPTDQDK